jgi:hypothetical protein
MLSISRSVPTPENCEKKDVQQENWGVLGGFANQDLVKPTNPMAAKSWELLARPALDEVKPEIGKEATCWARSQEH